MITKKFHGSVLYGPLGELEGGPFLSMDKNGPMELFCYHIWTPGTKLGESVFAVTVPTQGVYEIHKVIF